MLKANIRYEDGTGGKIKELLGVDVVTNAKSDNLFLYREDPDDIYQGINWARIIHIATFEEK